MKENGCEVFAPEFTNQGGGFRASYFAELASLEAGNFWFRARNKLILWAIEKYVPQFRSMLEIGCGTAYVLAGIADRYPEKQLFGSEIFLTGLSFASKRLPSATFMQMDARDIPFEQEFDLVGAFDVLEHIKEDELVLRQVHAALTPGGILILTVPQHGWLWSTVDEYACHERRYDVDQLHHILKKAGFKILRSTSFVSTLLPVMAVSRLLNRKSSSTDFDALAEFNMPTWLNALLFAVLSWELRAIKLGVNLPIGGSRLVLAVKSE